jgi:hypothetical protein
MSATVARQFCHIRSRDELKQELREQAQALRMSAASWDQGHLWEAKRLAATAYILLHDGGRNSKSLLGQLGLKGAMLSTADHDDSAPMPLAIITLDVKAGGKGATFTPRLDQHSTKRASLPFNRWYDENIGAGGRRLSRKNLIFTFRSQAGGAHVDAGISDDAFQWLRADGPIHLTSSPSGPARNANGNEVECPPELENIYADLSGPVPNGHSASMRQIAWEIDQCLIALGY